MYSDKAFFLTKIDQAELDNITKQNEDNLNAAIAVADSHIDSFIRTRVKVLPLTDPPEIIKACSFHLAMKELYSRVAPNNIADFIIKNADDAIAFLNKIQKGTVKLFPEIAETQQESFIISGGFPTVMTRRG